MNDETLINFGSAVKAVEGTPGKYGGYLVLFSDKSAPDLAGDFFTKDTDFHFDDGDTRPVFYNHGFDNEAGTTQIGKASLKLDDTGVWMDAQLDARNKYARAVMKLADDGAQGLSSGALAHLVRREEVSKSANWVKDWTIGEASFTPTPCEPRTKIMSVKSWAESLIPEKPTAHPPGKGADMENPFQKAYSTFKAGWDAALGVKSKPEEDDDEMTDEEKAAKIKKDEYQAEMKAVSFRIAALESKEQQMEAESRELKAALALAQSAETKSKAETNAQYIEKMKAEGFMKPAAEKAALSLLETDAPAFKSFLELNGVFPMTTSDTKGTVKGSEVAQTLVSTGDDFVDAIKAKMKSDSIDYSSAMKIVAMSNPELIADR